jgi:hypothetical protein
MLTLRDTIDPKWWPELDVIDQAAAPLLPQHNTGQHPAPAALSGPAAAASAAARAFLPRSQTATPNTTITPSPTPHGPPRGPVHPEPGQAR